jgi:lipoate-protein ligase A
MARRNSLFYVKFFVPAVIVGRNTSSWDEINHRGMESIIVGWNQSSWDEINHRGTQSIIVG